MAEKPYQDADELERLYWDEEWTTGEIADHFECNTGTVVYWMDKHGIPREEPGKRRREHDSRLYDKKSLAELYHGEGLTTYEIADELDCPASLVQDWMDKLGVERRSNADSNLTEAGRWLRDNLDGLRRMYHDEGMSMTEVAENIGTTQSNVSLWMRRHGIETRTPKESRDLRGTQHVPEPEGPHSDPGWLEQKYYDEGLTLQQIADEAGVMSGVTILRWMERFGMDRRTPGDYLRKEDSIRTAKHDDHEQIRFCHNGTTYYYDVHRLVAIAEFGLEEVAGKIVHHKNGIPWDNRPQNLELIDSQAEHARMHNEERNRDKLGRYA